MATLPSRTDPFATPESYSSGGQFVSWFFDRRWFLFLCVIIPFPGWILLLMRPFYKSQMQKPAQQWLANLCEERQAIAFDQVVYLGGHPAFPLPEEGALFIRGTDLHIELRSGGCIDIPFSAVGNPEVHSREEQGLFVTQQIAGLLLTSEILRRTEFFLEVPFKDDKSFDNTLRLACGKFVSPNVLANLVTSGRYHAAPSPGSQNGG